MAATEIYTYVHRLSRRVGLPSARWLALGAGSPSVRRAPRTSTRSTAKASKAATTCRRSSQRRRESSTRRSPTPDNARPQWERPRPRFAPIVAIRKCRHSRESGTPTALFFEAAKTQDSRFRSDEGRGGQEEVSQFRHRWSPQP